MEERLPLLEGGQKRGTILCRNEGCYLTFTIDVPIWGSGVKKVWLVSDHGGKLLLGTLMPENHRLRLSRRLSHSTLRCCGMSAPTSGMIDPPGAALPDGWLDGKTLHFKDPYLNCQLQESHNGMWRRENGRIHLRFPWRQGEAVPMMSLFCLADPQDGWWNLSLSEELCEE